MNRTNSAALAALVAAFALTACQLKPGGQCESQSDCDPGRLCLDGVCVLPAPGGASCTKDLECAPWATCQSDVCVMDEGRCSVGDDCQEWEYCEPTEEPGDLPGDPPKFEAYSCRLLPNRCYLVMDCDHGYEGWQVCVDHTCQLGPGKCAQEADCTNAWESCDVAAHTCVLDAGRCGTDADCPGQGDWQVCGDPSHVCELVAGRCADDANCFGYQTCDATHVCAEKPMTAGRVYATGQLEGTLGWGAYGVAPVDDPFDARLDLVWPQSGVALGNFSYVRADGSVVFMVMEAGGYQIRRFAPEWPTWDGYAWDGPVKPLENDPVLVANTLCGNIEDFVMQAGTEAILWNCPDPATTLPRYYAEGNTPGTDAPKLTDRRIAAWTAGGLMLVMPSNSQDSAYVIDASGVEHAVTGLPASIMLEHARADGEAFRVALGYQNDALAAERWRVAPDGTATREGVFAAPPAGVQPSRFWGYGVLDGAGDLYQYDSFAEKIVRRPLEPSTSVLVRGNDVSHGLGTGVNDTEAQPFVPYVVLGSTLLFTSP